MEVINLFSNMKTKKNLPDFELKTLDNGARILYQVDSRIPKIHMRFVSFGGPMYEDNSQRGITGILATLLMKDTKAKTALEVADKIESVGGNLSEFVGNNSFGFGIEVLSNDIEVAIELFDEALLKPAFKQVTFQIERDAQIAQVKEDLDEIVDFGLKSLRKKFFGDHPFAVDAYGEIENIETLNLHDIQNHYEKLICGSNIVLSISGDFDEKLLEKVEKVLCQLPDRTFNKAALNFSATNKSKSFTEYLSREQAVVFQAYEISGILENNYYYYELLEEMFSEMSGNLFMRVRDEKGLAYFVGANRVVGLGCGMFYFYSGTQSKSVENVFKEFDAEINRVSSGGVLESELKRCKIRLKTQKRMNQQTIGSRAMDAGLNELYGFPQNNWKLYDEKIDSISIDDLKNAVSAWTEKDYTRLVVKSPDAIE